MLSSGALVLFFALSIAVDTFVYIRERRYGIIWHSCIGNIRRMANGCGYLPLFDRIRSCIHPHVSVEGVKNELGMFCMRRNIL